MTFEEELMGGINKEINKLEKVNEIYSDVLGKSKPELEKRIKELKSIRFEKN